MSDLPESLDPSSPIEDPTVPICDSSARPPSSSSETLDLKEDSSVPSPSPSSSSVSSGNPPPFSEKSRSTRGRVRRSHYPEFPRCDTFLLSKCGYDEDYEDAVKLLFSQQTKDPNHIRLDDPNPVEELCLVYNPTKESCYNWADQTCNVVSMSDSLSILGGDVSLAAPLLGYLKALSDAHFVRLQQAKQAILRFVSPLLETSETSKIDLPTMFGRAGEVHHNLLKGLMLCDRTLRSDEPTNWVEMQSGTIYCGVVFLCVDERISTGETEEEEEGETISGEMQDDEAVSVKGSQVEDFEAGSQAGDDPEPSRTDFPVTDVVVYVGKADHGIRDRWTGHFRKRPRCCIDKFFFLPKDGVQVKAVFLFLLDSCLVLEKSEGGWISAVKDHLKLYSGEESFAHMYFANQRIEPVDAKYQFTSWKKQKKRTQ